MGLSIGSNIASLRAQSQLNRSSQSLNKSYERLSSGLRINSASDDPAGLAIADSLRSDARIASVAIRNANDGISVTSIADAALDEIGNMLTRMGELAEQAATGTYTNVQRSSLSLEFVALGSEIDRVAKTTEFNGIKLLSGSNSIALQVGFRGDSSSRITINAVQGTLESLGLSPNASNSLTYSLNGISTTEAQSASQLALTAVTNALTSLTTTRGTLGAVESRLSTAINFVSSTRENYLAAESRVRDTDIAAEVTEMVRLQVLQQAGTAVLAQANQQPAMVLGLLG
jgi:flagellin